MTKIAWAAGGTLVAAACLILWLTVAMDYGDTVAAGTYHFERGQESSTLVLNADHTFRQSLTIKGSEKNSIGTWRRVGEGGVSFSIGFLVVSGSLSGPDGTTFSDMHKALGVFPSLHFRQYHVLDYNKREARSSLAGTYSFDEPGVTSTLVLDADHSFTQTITRNSNQTHSVGTWKQENDGSVHFSNAFLKTSGEPIQSDETASAMNPQGLDLQVEISKTASTPIAVFRKRFPY